MSSEPEPSQSLEQHPGSLDDPSVPQRAGAIVAEVINSIADETKARADDLRATAEADGRAEVDAAREASGKVRTCLDDLAGKLGELRSGIQHEEGLLSSSLGQVRSGSEPPAISAPVATAPPEQDHPEPVVDAEVVEDDAPDETASATVVLPPDPATQRQKRRRRLWRR